MTILGGWNLEEIKGCNLPQKVQSAFTAITGDMVGADYEPIAYLGSQVVNGNELPDFSVTEASNPEHGETNSEDDNSRGD